MGFVIAYPLIIVNDYTNKFLENEKFSMVPFEKMYVTCTSVIQQFSRPVEHRILY